MRTIIKSLLTIAVALFATTVMAQRPAHGQDSKTPAEIAQMRTDRMNKDLTLSDKQKKEIYEFYLKSAEERASQRANGDATQTKEQRREAMQKMATEHNAQLKMILSKEQYAKYEELQKQRMEQMKQRQGQNGAAAKCENCGKEGCNKECPKKGDCNKDCPKK